MFYDDNEDDFDGKTIKYPHRHSSFLHGKSYQLTNIYQSGYMNVLHIRESIKTSDIKVLSEIIIIL